MLLTFVGPIALMAAMLLCGWLGAPSRVLASERNTLAPANETVNAAGKRLQPGSEIAAPLTVITAEDIRAHGFHTLGEALRWVRGMYVTSDRVYSYLGVRGIQRPGDFNNKVHLAIDGHPMNGNVFGDAYFDASLGIDLDLVDRIEIVHGPSSELYGNNALLALVNVVMRRPSEGFSSLVAGRAGSAGRKQALVSLASARPGQPSVSASGSWLNARGLDLYYPEFDSPATNQGRAIDADGEESRAFFGTAEWRSLRLVAKFNERVKRIPTGSFGTLFGDNRYRAYDGHDFVELSAERRSAPTLGLFARTYWDRAHYHATYVYDSGSGVLLNHDTGNGDVLGAELLALWTPGNAHALTVGVEGVSKATARIKNNDVEPYALYVDTKEDRTLLASYVQDRIRLVPDLYLTAGTRVDRWNLFDTEWSPSLGLSWRDPRGTQWKVHAAHGFRAPTAYETLYEGSTVQAGSTLMPEHASTLQGTIVHAFGATQTLVTGYVSQIRDLIDLTQIDSAGTVQYQNIDHVASRGLEAEAKLVPAAGAELRVILAIQSSVLHSTDERLTNSPAWDAGLVYRRDPMRGPWGVGAGVRYLSPRRMRTGRETSAALCADTRVSYRIGSLATVGIEIKNVFDSRYGDPASAEFVQEQILQDPRAFFLTLALQSSTAP